MSEKVNVSESGEHTYNTRRFQIFCLNHFMMNEFMAVFDGVGFTDIDNGTQYPFANAVRMFNEREEDCLSDYPIERVKLHYCKKSKRIVCTSQMVKLTDEFKKEFEEEGVDPLKGLVSFMDNTRLR